VNDKFVSKRGFNYFKNEILQHIRVQWDLNLAGKWGQLIVLYNKTDPRFELCMQ
jgi:hypothetical protein